MTDEPTEVEAAAMALLDSYDDLTDYDPHADVDLLDDKMHDLRMALLRAGWARGWAHDDVLLD